MLLPFTCSMTNHILMPVRRVIQSQREGALSHDPGAFAALHSPVKGEIIKLRLYHTKSRCWYLGNPIVGVVSSTEA